MAAAYSGRQRVWSMSSRRNRKRPPAARAARQPSSAERACPRCRYPVGLGANRVTTGGLFSNIAPHPSAAAAGASRTAMMPSSRSSIWKAAASSSIGKSTQTVSPTITSSICRFAIARGTCRLTSAQIAEIALVSGRSAQIVYRAGEPELTREPPIRPCTGGPSAAINDDDIDICLLRYDPSNLPEPSPSQRIRPQASRLSMEISNYKFTSIALNIAEHQQVASGCHMRTVVTMPALISSTNSIVMSAAVHTRRS